MLRVTIDSMKNNEGDINIESFVRYVLNYGGL